jgi:hypothetical protein
MRSGSVGSTPIDGVDLRETATASSAPSCLLVLPSSLQCSLFGTLGSGYVGRGDTVPASDAPKIRSRPATTLLSASFPSRSESSLLYVSLSACHVFLRLSLSRWPYTAYLGRGGVSGRAKGQPKRVSHWVFTPRSPFPKYLRLERKN